MPRKGFPGGSDGKESACNEGDPSLVPMLATNGLISGEQLESPVEFHSSTSLEQKSLSWCYITEKDFNLSP